MWTSTDKSVQVVDGRRYLVDAVTMARIVNAQNFRETVGADLRVRWDRIETRLDAALRQTYGKRTFEAALSKDRAVMMREIRDQVRSRSAEYRHRDRRCPDPCAPISWRRCSRIPMSG